ncbi:hypothetical protein B0O80DRAFT_449959 [Mortierella sp. GBAus27b]|nr:Protein OS-9 [Mortierella sp. GBA43]KAI8354866.1 hypothetical protein B0O80DRAFT_449959 [Mortierella sp. GBAus27b]
MVKYLSPCRASFLVSASILSLLSLVPGIASSYYPVGFVYNDLLAHPQFHVQFHDELVPMSAIGADRLERGNRHSHQDPVKVTPQIETVKDEIHGQDPPSTVGISEDKGEQSSQSTQSSVDVSSGVIMTDAQGQRWTCTIPPAIIHKDQPMPEKTPQEAEEEERRSIKRGLELLEPLTKRCLRTNFGYWTYEYCHKNRVRQYYAGDDGKWEPLSEDQTYLLGMYHPRPEETQAKKNPDGSIQQQKQLNTGRPSTITELSVSNERRYLVQRLEHGEICDKTGARRSVEVQFQCANVDDRIHLVTEPSTCNYIMVIHSSSLCKDLAFEPIPAPEANKIDCKRIVSDELFERTRSSGPEAIEGESAPVAFQDSTEQVKLNQKEEQSKQPPPDKAAQNGPKLPLAFRELAELVGKAEEAKKKQLDQVLDVYLQALKPRVTEEEMKMLQKMLDLMDGKMDHIQIIEQDQNMQLLEFDTLLESLYNKAGDTKGRTDETQAQGKLQGNNKAAPEANTQSKGGESLAKDSLAGETSGDDSSASADEDQRVQGKNNDKGQVQDKRFL